MKCIFTIDVEDWFHILDLPSTPDISQWGKLPSHVEKNFLRLLDILSENNTHATCFFLGWIAEQFPHLVREAAARGHEIASHGHSHRLVFEMGPRDFLEDAARSKKIIENVIGQSVAGYRASGFSVTDETPWFFDKLIEAGYLYDSSVFPAVRGHGGMQDGQCSPYRLESSPDFVEFPVSIQEVLGKRLCFFGGGYLRLFPYSIIRAMARKVLDQNRPVIFYVHPREIDPDHPKLPMGWKRKFRSYVNLSSTEGKIRKLLSEFEMVTFQQFLSSEWNKPPLNNQNGSVAQELNIQHAR